MLRKIIFKFHSHISRGLCNILIHYQWLCSNHTADSSICTFYSLNYYINLILIFHCHYLVITKSDSSREIFVQNSNFAFGIVTEKSFLLLVLWVINLDAKVKVWLPITIVENLNVKNLLIFLFPHGYDFIKMFILCTFFGSSFTSFDTESAFLVCIFLNDSNFNLTCTLCN